MDYQFIEIDKLNVCYVNINSNGKSAVLLIHGLGGSIESWASNIEGLSKEVHVIALDLPGFGNSDKPKMSYSISFYSDFVAKFVKEMNASPSMITGSSLGGHIAAEVAIRHPEVVSRLAMISPSGALPKSFTGTPALKKYVKILAANTVQEVKQALSAVDGKPVDDRYAEALYSKLAAPGAKDAFLSALNGSANAPRLNSRLGRIKVPTLVFWGKDDLMIPVRYSTPFIKMKNCRVVLLENCGHRVHADKPQAFNRILAGFALEC